VHNIERLISAESAETVAAVVMDPMASAIAVACPPDSYMRDLRAVCDHYGVLLVADEIITGMGRTGRLFAIEYSGITPGPHLGLLPDQRDTDRRARRRDVPTTRRRSATAMPTLAGRSPRWRRRGHEVRPGPWGFALGLRFLHR
jgi:hypothetical protein